LLGQLVQIKLDSIEPHLKEINDIVSLRNSKYYDWLLLATWRTLKVYFKAVDKNKLKLQLDFILEPLFRDIQSIFFFSYL
jgi:hypothetical protein